KVTVIDGGQNPGGSPGRRAASYTRRGPAAANLLTDTKAPLPRHGRGRRPVLGQVSFSSAVPSPTKSSLAHASAASSFHVPSSSRVVMTVNVENGASMLVGVPSASVPRLVPVRWMSTPTIGPTSSLSVYTPS